MKRLPGLNRLTIRLQNEEIQVQAIMINPGRCPELLSYDHSCNLSIFKDLDMSTIANHQIGLIYELPGNEKFQSKFRKLEKLFKRQDNQYQIGVFNEPASNFSSIYLIGHLEDKFGLGPYIKSAKIGVFQFSYQELFGSSNDNYLQYLSVCSEANIETTNGIRSLIDKSQSIEVELMHLKSDYAKLSEKNNHLQSKIVTARNLIRRSSKAIEEDAANRIFDCIKCKNNVRNIMLLPCGDLSICKECFVFAFKVPLNKVFKNSTVKCPKCNEIITQAVEVLF